MNPQTQEKELQNAKLKNRHFVAIDIKTNDGQTHEFCGSLPDKNEFDLMLILNELIELADGE